MRDDTPGYVLVRSMTCLSVQYRRDPDQPWEIWSGYPGPEGLEYGYCRTVASGAVGSRENAVATVAELVIGAKRRFSSVQFRAVERPGALENQWTEIPRDEIARCVQAARSHWGDTAAAKTAENISAACAAAGEE